MHDWDTARSYFVTGSLSLYPQRSPDSADFYMWGSIQDCLQTGDGDNFKYLMD
jgi:hypothetical protein